MKPFRISLLLCAFLSGSLSVLPKDCETFDRDYIVEGAGIASQGNYLVKVTVSSNNKNLDDSELVTAAVHGVIFRGFVITDNNHTQKPMSSNAQDEVRHLDFYCNFFSKDGTASTFGDIIPGTRQVLKSGKKYKISAIANVRKESLRKYLTDAGVIKNLNSIF